MTQKSKPTNIHLSLGDHYGLNGNKSSTLNVLLSIQSPAALYHGYTFDQFLCLRNYKQTQKTQSKGKEDNVRDKGGFMRRKRCGVEREDIGEAEEVG